MTPRIASRIIALGFVACAAAGCSAIEVAGDNPQQAAHNGAARYASAACFYSNVSGADRIVDGRLLHWCGPEPRALF